MQGRLSALLMGVITIVIGLVLSTVIFDATADVGGGVGDAVEYTGAASGDNATCPAAAAYCLRKGSSTKILAGAATTNTTANGYEAYYPQVGSFAGTQAIVNLVPLIFVVSIVMVGIGMIGIGAGGMMGKGPLAAR